MLLHLNTLIELGFTTGFTGHTMAQRIRSKRLVNVHAEIKCEYTVGMKFNKNVLYASKHLAKPILSKPAKVVIS